LWPHPLTTEDFFSRKVNKSSLQIDVLLEPLLLTGSGEEADQILSELIAVHAEPVINGIISYKLRLKHGQSSARAEVEDLRQEAIEQLLIELQKLRSHPERHPIGDVRGLAATITYRLCARWMRRQFPEQQSIRNRIQYLLTRQAGFALWPDDRNKLKKMMAGFAAWRGQSLRAGQANLRQLVQDGSLPGVLGGGGKSTDLKEVLAGIFNRVGGPVEFDELVRSISIILQIKDPVVKSFDGDEDGPGFELADKEADVAWRVEKRIFLQRLWEELRQLPLQQRVALLLNLRDSEGRGCIALFPATGVATIRQLAEVLEMSPENLAELWNELPVEDSKIAELLKLTRQQVINTRKSARERLTRRLKGFI
jgi:hypothetical protein